MEKINLATWRRSSRCGSSACVEVAKVADRYVIRSSEDPDGPVVSFTAAEWTAFVAGIEAGDFRF